MKAILVPGAVALALAVATVTPGALHLLDWHSAGTAFDTAVAVAEQAEADAAEARNAVEEARDAATLALEDASGVVSAGTGYLAAAAIVELTSANTEATEALAEESTRISAMPGTERPDTLATLRESTTRLGEWAESVRVAVAAHSEDAESLDQLASATDEAAVVAARSVIAESGAALAVAPIASADTRGALEAARDALLAAVEQEEPLAGHVTAYAAAVEAMFTSQRAEAEAQAKAEAEYSPREAADWWPVVVPPLVFPPIAPITPEQWCAGGAYLFCPGVPDYYE